MTRGRSYLMNIEEILRKRIQELNKREAELQQAKSRLEKIRRRDNFDIMLAAEKAKREGKQAVIEKLIPILPSSNSTFIQGSARVLTRDIRKIIDEYKK